MRTSPPPGLASHEAQLGKLAELTKTKKDSTTQTNAPRTARPHSWPSAATRTRKRICAWPRIQRKGRGIIRLSRGRGINPSLLLLLERDDLRGNGGGGYVVFLIFFNVGRMAMAGTLILNKPDVKVEMTMIRDKHTLLMFYLFSFSLFILLSSCSLSLSPPLCAKKKKAQGILKRIGSSSIAIWEARKKHSMTHLLTSLIKDCPKQANTVFPTSEPSLVKKGQSKTPVTNSPFPPLNDPISKVGIDTCKPLFPISYPICHFPSSPIQLFLLLVFQ